MPADIRLGASVQYGNTFLAVGGYDDDNEQYLDTVYMFDVEEESWILMPQRMEEGRWELPAFLVPDDFASC